MKYLLITVSILATINIGCIRKSTSDAPKPNFVFIIADDCTFDDIGCYGGPAYTPNIDQFAREGMKFTQAFQTAPMCSPTRHSIYSGLYPVKSGAYPNHAYAYDDVKSIVKYLKPLGYRVALSGKKHIGPDSVYPFEYSVSTALGQTRPLNSPDFDVIDELMASSKENKTPFCVFVTSNQPHGPHNLGDPSRYPPDKIKLRPYFIDNEFTREELSRYYAEITYFDDEVGRTLDLLKKYELEENTMVIVTTEQGNEFPYAKWTCYDAGLQTAFLVRWPGKIKPNTVTNAMIEYVDVLPTFVEAAGGKVDDNVDGKSILPVLFGKTNEHKKEVYGLMTTRGIKYGSDCYPIRSIRTKDYKLIWNLNYTERYTNVMTEKSPLIASWRETIKEGDPDDLEKLQRYQFHPEFELYAIKEDKIEWNNLADDPVYKEIITDLKSRLEAWMEVQGDKGIQTELEAFEHQETGREEQ